MAKAKAKAKAKKSERAPRRGEVWTLTERRPKWMSQRDVMVLRVVRWAGWGAHVVCIAATRSSVGKIATLRVARMTKASWVKQEPRYRRRVAL